jgi:hypothetical protein
VSAPPHPVDPPADGSTDHLADSTASSAVARLMARVAALEAALERRSEELKQLQAALPPRELVALSRRLAGLSPSPVSRYDPEGWRETVDLTPADVEETLADLWRSLGGERPA